MQKLNSFVFFLMLVVVSFTSTSIIAQNVVISPLDIINYKVHNHSYVSWEASKITGKHKGKISISSGKLIFRDSLLTDVGLTIDMTSMTCSDLLDEEQNQKLIDHLKSPDFFDVEKYPTAEIVIKDVIYYGRNSKSNSHKYKLNGNMTIKGIKKPVSVVTDIYLAHKSQLSAIAPLIIDRSEFNIKYGSGTFFDNLGDKIIEDEIKLYVSLIATI